MGLVNADYSTERQNLTFGYQTINGYETNRLVRITDNTNKGTDSTTTYDVNGNIIGITYGDESYGNQAYGNQTHEYEYDALGRLTKETINGVATTRIRMIARTTSQAKR